MSQQIINIGATPNDGLGDPIRTAFEKTNENFTELYANSTVPYTISNGNSNVSINSANANITFSVNDTNNVVVVTDSKLLVAGNISGNYILGNGAYLTGISGGSSNANTLTGDTLSSNVVYSSLTSLGILSNLDVSVDINTGNLSASGNVTGDYILGNGAYLTGISGGVANTGNVTFDNVNIIGTGNLKLQPDANSSGAYLDIYLTAGPDIHIAGNGENVIVGTDSGSNVTVGVDGNVTIQANSSSSYTWTFDNTGILNVPGNINFATTSANIVAGNTLGNLSGVGDIIGLTNGIDGNGYPNYFALDGNGNLHIGQNTGVSSGAITWDGGGSQLFEDIGGLVVQGYNGTVGIAGAGSDANLVVYGNITTDNLSTTGSNGNISGAYIISAEYFYGDGSNITGITAGSAAANELTGNTLSSNVLYSSLTSVGTLGNLSVSGNVYTSNIISQSGALQLSANVAEPELAWSIVNDSYPAGSNNSAFVSPLSDDIHVGEIFLQASTGNAIVTFAGPNNGSFSNSYSVITDLGNIVLSTTDSNSNTYISTLDLTGNLTVANNIIATGNLTSIGKTVQVGDSAANSVAVNGAGLVAGNNVATLLYNSSVFGWTVNQSLHPSANVSYSLGRSNRVWNSVYSVDIITPPVPLANLITAAGARAFINNSNLVALGNFGAMVSDSGSNVVPVWSDGTNWYIG